MDIRLEHEADAGPVTLYDAEAFAGMHAAGRLAADVLDMLVPHVTPGTPTAKLDRLAYAFMRDHGAIPATLGYKGYTHSLCTSLNHVICHGIPSEKPLRDGDILNIDVTVILDGWHGDTSRMFAAGEPPLKARRLMDVTYECLMRGVAAARPGNTLGDIGWAIQAYAEKNRCTVVKEFCGHGVGRRFHEPPNVVHAGRPGRGLKLVPGMIFTIEPMINLGRPDAKVLDDGWTAVTRDRALSAQFEHSVGITETGCEVFTRSALGFDKPPY